jgi:acetyl-CoA acetyltransferase
LALDEAHLGPSDIDFFGLYDCFPICLLRAIEAVGLTDKGQAGRYIDRVYDQLVPFLNGSRPFLSPDCRPQDVLPVNTHGGLMAFGAPWEVPAMYNIIEACLQLRGQAGHRQISNVKRALVYGNGGIFSASAVAVLGRGNYV